MRVLMNFRVLLLVLLLLAAVGCKQQVKSDDPDYVAAHKLFEQREFDKSFMLMLKSANNGNLEAQIDVGWMYKNGLGVLQDIDEAKKWYKKSALAGNDKAMHALGRMYLDIYMDCEKAEMWFLRAVKLNSSSSALELYNMYRTGQCFDANQKKADEYFDLILKNNSDLLVLAEGDRLYWSARDKNDYLNAIRLLEKVFNKYPSVAGYDLGLAYFNGQGVAVSREKAAKYFEVSAFAGHVKSQYNYGICLYNGWGVKIDKSKAYEWINKAANKNDNLALTMIGYMYESGEFVERDIERAKEYYQRAAKLGDSRAQNRLNRLK